ncbi:DUF3306 domain-containing protein [Falsiroseomonas selenitidurans]|uniref:DUF3306 domain-containing protein n=1 Tax=Falsiroseomonas selenitidurans TaxID=2716335 RepID=UPI001ADE919B|nr:DUF3306 domain-containing protein [Falsiroseomonas selenitidurans]
MTAGTRGEADGFLSRWSRLKRSPPRAPEPVPEPAPEAVAEATPLAEAVAVPVEPVADLDLPALPPIEALTEASDITAFLRPGIPTALRSAALRRMWSLDPAIRDFIGPADYAWDFNDPAGMPGGFALDLGGDVKTLLAQAIGTPEPRAPELAVPDPVAPPQDEAAPLLAEAAPPQEEPLALPPEEPAAEEEDQPPPRRRHGSALPA